MEKKRKLPARGGGRSEGGNSSKKSRTSTPPEARDPTPQPPEPEALPTSIAPGRSLPTVSQAQASNLPSTQYQSVAESGVMAESLDRSRKKWVNEGLFEKYWTKPSKKKGAASEPPDNPLKESMSKLGACTLTIEPHIFDIVLYSIKDPSKPPAPLPQSMYRPIIQYGPPPPSSIPQTQSQFSPRPSSQVSRSQDGNPSAFGNAAPTLNNGKSSASSSQVAPTSKFQSHSVPTVNQGHSAQTTSPPPSPKQPSTGPVRKNDPVIQMLAERAATDENLKALMRIVADGSATLDELKKFQSHIDELTHLMRSRQATTPMHQQPPNQQPLPPPSSSTTAPHERAPLSSFPANGGPSPATNTQNNRVTHLSSNQNGHQSGTNHQYMGQSQALRSKGPPPPMKPDTSRICFEFLGGSGDRFLFPRYAILETCPSPSLIPSVVASFLIVRKGSSASALGYDPKVDYYQPVTCRLQAHFSRLLENLQKVVAPQEEVRKYLDDIMDNATRAEYVLLAMQLPREVELPAEQVEAPAQTNQTDDHSNGILWTAPATQGISAIAQKPPLASSADRYNNFIHTVS